MAVAVFNDFLKEFEQPITQFVSNAVRTSQHTWTHRCVPRRPCTSCFMASLSYAARSASRSMDFAWRSMRLALIVALATNPSTFQTYVAGLFFESLPKEVGNAIAGSGLDTSSGAPFDKLLNKGPEDL